MLKKIYRKIALWAFHVAIFFMQKEIGIDIKYKITERDGGMNIDFIFGDGSDDNSDCM